MCMGKSVEILQSNTDEMRSLDNNRLYEEKHRTASSKDQNGNQGHSVHKNNIPLKSSNASQSKIHHLRDLKFSKISI